MKLLEHFRNTVNKEAILKEAETKKDVEEKIKQYESVFIDGELDQRLTIHSDGKISYDGEIEFGVFSYVDNSRRLPFTFYKVQKLALLAGYTKKLDSLEGLPEDCDELIIVVAEEKPSSFFEGHFPKRIRTLLDLTVVSLKNCKFGIEKFDDRAGFDLMVDEDKTIDSLEGLPDDIHRVRFEASVSQIKSFKGLPKRIFILNFYGRRNDPFDVRDLVANADTIGSITTLATTLVDDCPILSLFKIKHLSKIESDASFSGESPCSKVLRIVSKHLKEGDAFACQEELFDKGFERYAKTK